MLHIAKLAVGVRDTEQLRQWQALRQQTEPMLCHRTRNFPRRAAEVLEGGSLFWVISGAMVVRQLILDIVRDRWDDGTECTGLVLDPALVPVAARPTKPFQGWRYMQAEAAPPDIETPGAPDGEASLPEAMRRDLRALCLL